MTSAPPGRVAAADRARSAAGRPDMSSVDSASFGSELPAAPVVVDVVAVRCMSEPCGGLHVLHTEGDSPGGNSVAQIYHPVPAVRCSTCGMCASASEALYGTGVLTGAYWLQHSVFEGQD